MTKQLLIYEEVVPLTTEAHANSHMRLITDFEFARDLRIVPILLSEFRKACLDFPIVFISGEDQAPFPVAVLSLGAELNQYISSGNEWNAGYIPAFIRRYPFVFTKSSDDQQYYLCIDQLCKNINQLGEGERLFDEAGQPSAFTQQMLDFLKSYEIERKLTIDFCKELQDLNLVESKQLSSKQTSDNPETQEVVRLSGFMTVDQSRVDTLTDQKLLSLRRQGGLEAIAYHWASLENFNNPRFSS